MAGMDLGIGLLLVAAAGLVAAVTFAVLAGRMSAGIFFDATRERDV